MTAKPPPEPASMKVCKRWYVTLACLNHPEGDTVPKNCARARPLVPAGVMAVTKTAKPPPEPVWSAFDSWRQAYGWGYHVSRASHQKVIVRKINGRWRARRIPPNGKAAQ